MNKASGGDGIPAELFEVQNMMLLKCCSQYASKFGKLSNGHRTGRGQFSFQSQRKGKVNHPERKIWKEKVKEEKPWLYFNIPVNSQMPYSEIIYWWRNSSWVISNSETWCCERAALNMPANLENSAVATGLEKVSFHSNPKERQCQRMLKLLHNCTHLTGWWAHRVGHDWSNLAAVSSSSSR